MFQTGNGLSIDDLYRAVKDGIQYGASHREEKDERTREEIVLDYLRSYGWQFRHNYIKNKREFMRAKDNVWTEIGEYFFPDLAVVMGLEIRKTASVEGLKLVVNHLVNRHVYHAGRAFLENCPGKVYTDDDNALRRFMSGISTEDHQELLYWSLRKWFLEALYTIAAIEIDNSKANHTCLVFYGPQGVGKTSVTKLLVPHELQDFYYQDDFTKERDASNKLSEVFFINLDDIDNMYKNESKGLKSLISQSVINTRKAWKEEAPPTRSAVANFMATTNHIEFLTDETGNRRYFPVEITRLDWSVVTKDLFAEIWQEAKQDYIDGRLDEIRKKTFALQPERQQHIERFEMPTGAEDYINTFFRPTKPDATSPPLLITMGQFEQAFSFYYKTVDKHLFNNRALGRVFNKLGYPPKVSVFVNKCRQVFIAEGVSHPLVDFIRDCDRFNLRYINTPPTPQEVGSFGGAVEDNPPDVSDTFPASN